jgi:hypothetical protein
MLPRFAVLLAALGPVFVAAGCSSSGGKGPDQTPEQQVMAEVADMLRAATTPNGHGPAKLADLNRVKTLYTRGYDAVKSGQVVVLWGTNSVKGEGAIAQGGGEVVAYEKDVPNNGGYVLLSSGEIKKMTAAEFGAAPKAGKK